MSSLSAAETPLRGLTDGELIETLVDPLRVVSEIKGGLSRLQSQAWYLFLGVDQRVFFGQTANVTAEITEIAQNIAEEQVDNGAAIGGSRVAHRQGAGRRRRHGADRLFRPQLARRLRHQRRAGGRIDPQDQVADRPRQ